jgi:hypothetical protein
MEQTLNWMAQTDLTKVKTLMSTGITKMTEVGNYLIIEETK